MTVKIKLPIFSFLNLQLDNILSGERIHFKEVGGKGVIGKQSNLRTKIRCHYKHI